MLVEMGLMWSHAHIYIYADFLSVLQITKMYISLTRD